LDDAKHIARIIRRRRRFLAALSAGVYTANTNLNKETQMKVTVTSIPQPEPPKRVTIEMSEREAEVLFRVMGNVNGNGPNREIVNRFYATLGEAGVRWNNTGIVLTGTLTIADGGSFPKQG
jgi:chorismate mutase